MNCPYCNEEVTEDEAFNGELILAGDTGGELSHKKCVEQARLENEN